MRKKKKKKKRNKPRVVERSTTRGGDGGSRRGGGNGGRGRSEGPCRTGFRAVRFVLAAFREGLTRTVFLDKGVNVLSGIVLEVRDVHAVTRRVDLGRDAALQLDERRDHRSDTLDTLLFHPLKLLQHLWHLPVVVGVLRRPEDLHCVLVLFLRQRSLLIISLEPLCDLSFSHSPMINKTIKGSVSIAFFFFFWTFSI